MKTAISVPDDTFLAAKKRAQELGMSRSEFFSVAVRRYLDELERESITQQVDQALQAASEDDSAAVAAGRRRLSTGDGW
jgi:metal-responsive CopG/Arc/MetJ family transcriptional regulator